MSYLVLTNPKDPSGESLSFEEIQQRITDKKILGETQVWDEASTRWIDMKIHPSFQGLFAQTLWEAWAEVSQDIIQASPPQQETEEPPEPSTPIVSKTLTPSSFSLRSSAESPPVQSQESIEEIPLLDDLTPLPQEEEALPMLKEEEMLSLDEVFPQPEQVPKDIPLKVPRIQRPVPPVREESNFSLMRVALPILVGGCLIWLAFLYVQSIAHTNYQRPKPPPIEEKQEISVWKVEKRLRNTMSDEIIPLHPDASFEDILQVEFNRFGIRPIKMRAEVLAWTGRKEDQPKTARLRAQLEGSGALDEDITAVALVLGKYMERYFMDMEDIELCLDFDEDFFLCAMLDAEVARRFYLQRMSYPDFIAKILK